MATKPNKGDSDKEAKIKDVFFVYLARQSGQAIRMDFSWCYGGFGAKVMPDRDNPYGWQIIFDAPGDAGKGEVEND